MCVCVCVCVCVCIPTPRGYNLARREIVCDITTTTTFWGCWIYSTNTNAYENSDMKLGFFLFLN